MPVFACGDCVELHAQHRKWAGYTGFGTCGCTCPLCANEGRTLCSSCRGTGKGGLFSRTCKECNGERTVVCPICKGFLAHPNCHICRGRSCETCYGSRSADLEVVLAKLKPVPRRRTLFRPVAAPRAGDAMDFPVFTYERLWSRLEFVVDLEVPLSVPRDSGWERAHLTGEPIHGERADYWIYRVGDNEYGIVEPSGRAEWSPSPRSALAARRP